MGSLALVLAGIPVVVAASPRPVSLIAAEAAAMATIEPASLVLPDPATYSTQEAWILPDASPWAEIVPSPQAAPAESETEPTQQEAP